MVSATTQENRNLQVSWTAVAGASGYRIERAARRDGVATLVTTVTGSGTSFNDLVRASATPVTYIYYVRTIDSAGELSNRGAWDPATTATMLYAQPSLTGAIVRAGDVTELRLAIDALRYALYLPSAFGSTTAPAGKIPASDFTALVAALNGAHAAIGIVPFTYSGVAAPAPGVTIHRAHIEQIREALR